jgi:hypothetical protein
MAKDSRPEGQASGSPSQARSDAAARPSQAGQPEPVVADDLSDQDLDDIKSLLAQKQDVTRQDMPAQDFQTLLERFSKGT